VAIKGDPFGSWMDHAQDLAGKSGCQGFDALKGVTGGK
jgi:hypothetical protein